MLNRYFFLTVFLLFNVKAISDNSICLAPKTLSVLAQIKDGQHERVTHIRNVKSDKNNETYDIIELKSDKTYVRFTTFGSNIYNMTTNGIDVLESPDPDNPDNIDNLIKSPDTYGIPICFPWFYLWQKVFTFNDITHIVPDDLIAMRDENGMPVHGTVLNKKWDIKGAGEENGNPWVKTGYDINNFRLLSEKGDVLVSGKLSISLKITIVSNKLKIIPEINWTGEQDILIGYTHHTYLKGRENRDQIRLDAPVKSTLVLDEEGTIFSKRKLRKAEMFDGSKTLREMGYPEKLPYKDEDIKLLDNEFLDFDAEDDGTVCVKAIYPDNIKTTITFNNQYYKHLTIYEAEGHPNYKNEGGPLAPEVGLKPPKTVATHDHALENEKWKQAFVLKANIPFFPGEMTIEAHKIDEPVIKNSSVNSSV